MIKFKPMWGAEDALPPQITPGTLYFTTDTGKIFLDMEDGTRKSFIPDGGGVSGIPVPVTEGGTGGVAVRDARYNLEVPAEIDIGDGVSGFPFSYGSVISRGNLGNTIGQATSDNYYWGADSLGYLWAGYQINQATTPTWVRAAMMNGELGFTKIWAGDLTNGTIELPGARNYAALMVYGPPKGGEENVMSIVPAGSGIYVYHGGESSSFGYNTGTSNGHLAITITKNTEGGSIIGIYAMVCAKA